MSGAIPLPPPPLYFNGVRRNSFTLFTFVTVTIEGQGWLSRYSDSLRAGGSGDRIPVRARFSAPVHTSPGADPTSYIMGTRCVPRVNRPGCGVDHPPLSSAEVEGRVELYLCSPSGPSWSVLGRPLLYRYNYY